LTSHRSRGEGEIFRVEHAGWLDKATRHHAGEKTGERRRLAGLAAPLSQHVQGVLRVQGHSLQFVTPRCEILGLGQAPGFLNHEEREKSNRRYGEKSIPMTSSWPHDYP
jgi:hypothetical protein